MPPLHAAARPLDKEYRMDYVSYVSDLGLAARAASRAVARASTQLKNAALLAAADALDIALEITRRIGETSPLGTD
jgi:hypothetical protein